jgi:hypothetical protein
MKRLDYGSNITVFENQCLALDGSPDGKINHRSGQVVGPNHLIREQCAKHWADCAQKAVSEIRFLSWFHGADVRGPEKINARAPPRVVRSRPHPCSARRQADFVLLDLRRFRSRMRTTRWGCSHGALVRIRSCSPRLSCAVPYPTLSRYTRLGKR